MLLRAFSDLPPRKRIGMIAIVLGIIAVLIGNPYDKATAKVNIKEMVLLTDNSISSIGVDDLAGWIISKKMDYRLIDLRSSAEYEEYTIPTAESIPVDEILKSDLMKNEKIVLFGENDKIASQVWFILKASGYNGVYILQDGMKAWKNNIVFPTCTCGENPSEEQLQLHNKRAEVSKFFGGEMSSATANIEKQITEMPKLQAPAKIELNKPRGKKKREGC